MLELVILWPIVVGMVGQVNETRRGPQPHNTSSATQSISRKCHTARCERRREGRLFSFSEVDENDILAQERCAGEEPWSFNYANSEVKRMDNSTMLHVERSSPSGRVPKNKHSKKRKRNDLGYSKARSLEGQITWAPVSYQPRLIHSIQIIQVKWVRPAQLLNPDFKQYSCGST